MAGFLLFIILTVVTIRAVPAPLSHAGEAVDWLQSHLPDSFWAQTPGTLRLCTYMRCLPATALPKFTCTNRLSCASSHAHHHLTACWG